MISNRTVHLKFTKSRMAFIIGLLSAQNIVYIFRIGNTDVNILFIVALIFFLISLFKQRRLAIFFDSDFIVFIIAIIVSIVPYTIIVAFVLQTLKWTSYFVGLMILLANLILFDVVVYLKKYTNQILKGVFWGVCLNLLISLVQLIWFKRGIPFMYLLNLFPQNSFMISVPYANKSLAAGASFLVYSYRATGLFKESSYMSAYLSAFLILAVQKLNKRIKLFFFIVALSFMIVSATNNVIIFLFTWFCYLFFAKLTHTRETMLENIRTHRVNKSILNAIVAILLLIVLFIAVNGFDSLLSTFKLESFDVFSKNKSFDTRWGSMVDGIKLVLKYPFGVGYCMGSGMMKAEYSNQRVATFNYLILITLECGVLGLFGFLWYVTRTFFKLRKRINTRYGAALLSAFIGVVLSLILNGFTFESQPYIWIVFALCYIEKQ